MNPRDTAIEALEKRGVFKGADGLIGLLNADEFWDKQPYGTRLYFGDGPSDYLHRDVLRATVAALRSEVHEEKWISVKDESKLPPIHEEPFAEDGFVLILLQCADWPGKYKTMKASRTIGDWAEDGSPLWFWTDEEGEIIDDDDKLITHWMPLPQPPKP